MTKIEKKQQICMMPNNELVAFCWILSNKKPAQEALSEMEKNKCHYWITRSKSVLGYWDVQFNISEKDAISPFDVGEIKIFAVTRARAIEECEAMISLGYTMISSLRTALGLDQDTKELN